jgi:plasmid replication initiation protein
MKHISKSNDLVRATSRLSLIESRVLSLVLAQLKNNQYSYTITVKEYCETFDVSFDSAYNNLCSAVTNLQDRRITINKRDFVRSLRFVRYVDYYHDQGQIGLTFDDEILPHIFDLKSHYTTYQLKNIINLQSVNAFKLYEVAKSFQSVGVFTYSIDDLVLLLDLNTTIMQTNLQNKVLKPAIAVINDKTDIELSYTTGKTGKKVTGFTFLVVAKPTTPPSTKTTKKIDSRAAADRLAAPQAWKLG